MTAYLLQGNFATLIRKVMNTGKRAINHLKESFKKSCGQASSILSIGWWYWQKIGKGKDHVIIYTMAHLLLVIWDIPLCCISSSNDYYAILPCKAVISSTSCDNISFLGKERACWKFLKKDEEERVEESGIQCYRRSGLYSYYESQSNNADTIKPYPRLPKWFERAENFTSSRALLLSFLIPSFNSLNP